MPQLRSTYHLPDPYQAQHYLGPSLGTRLTTCVPEQVRTDYSYGAINLLPMILAGNSSPSTVE